MQIDAIGAVLNDRQATLTSANALSQEEFLRLFLTELNFQDPLEPMDNKEFLAQLAEFASLEQGQNMVDSLANIAFLSSTSQSVALLGKKVELLGNNVGFGEVTAISFASGSPLMTIKTAENNFLTDIRLSQIKLLSN